MLVSAARFPRSPLSLCFNRAGTHVKSFGHVIGGRLCQLVWAGCLWASVSTHLGRSFEGVHVNSFEWVIRVRSFEGGSFEGIRVN